MARAATQNFEQMVLEVEFDPVGASGTYSKICGITDVSVSRSSNIDETEVPDCDDESLPHHVDISVRSQQVTVSGSGVWALASHQKMMDWWYARTPLNVRLRNAKVTADGSAGDPETETGAAILVSLGNSRTRGQKVSAEIELRYTTLPTVADKSA